MATSRSDPAKNLMRGRLVVPLAWTAACVGLLCAMTFLLEGTVAALRCLLDAMTPPALVGWGLVAVTIDQFRIGRRFSCACVGLIASLWFAVSTPFLVDRMVRAVERPISTSPHPAFETWDEDQSLDAIVVLGGATRTVAPGLVEVLDDGERIVSAAQTWHAGRCRLIIVTGSTTTNESYGHVSHPRDESRALLESLGVPSDRIVAIEGVDTAKEMQSLKAFLVDPPKQCPIPLGGSSRIGLITSAFHMPRAIRLAKRHELDLIPLPCAFRQNDLRRSWVPADCHPRAGQLRKMQIVIKESLARLAGE
ncbi:MAG: YdcF family protein [Planctomycetota bacterium]